MALSIKKVEEKFGISKSVLYCYLKQSKGTPGEGIHFMKRGGQTCTFKCLEKVIVYCLVKCTEWSYPLSAFDLHCFVKYHLDIDGKDIAKFKDNMPGYEWHVV